MTKHIQYPSTRPIAHIDADFHDEDSGFYVTSVDVALCYGTLRGKVTSETLLQGLKEEAVELTQMWDNAKLDQLHAAGYYADPVKIDPNKVEVRLSNVVFRWVKFSNCTLYLDKPGTPYFIDNKCYARFFNCDLSGLKFDAESFRTAGRKVVIGDAEEVNAVRRHGQPVVRLTNGEAVEAYYHMKHAMIIDREDLAKHIR